MRGFHWNLPKKIIVGFAIIIVVLMVFIFYANSNFNSLLTQYDLALENNKKLGEFFDCLTRAHDYLRNYYYSHSISSNVNLFLEDYNRCFNLIAEMKPYMNDGYAYGKIVDLERMLRSYGEKANEALYNYSINDAFDAYASVAESERIVKLIESRHGFYARILTRATELRRQDLLISRDAQNVANFTIIACLALMCAVFTGVFIKTIQRPIKLLVENADQISRGNFDLPPIEIRTRDDMALLADAFNKMVQSIKYYIREKELQSKLQERLMEEENKNLRTEALLRKTQLNALQAQINPHFLFNTLNMIQQTAYLENASETRTMIETTAQLLRFYLDKSDMNISLKEEIENVEDYIYIQNKRIGRRIRFETRISADITDVLVPALIIQPLLENAILHGLDNCISDGRVVVCVTEGPELIHISVSDNGKGMDDETISRILSKRLDKDAGSIGLQNVIERLELFFGRKGLVEIFSAPDAGARIEMTLPKTLKEETPDVQAAHS